MADSADADAILIGRAGLHAAGIVERFERELGKVVVTHQVATVWHALHNMGNRTRTR